VPGAHGGEVVIGEWGWFVIVLGGTVVVCLLVYAGLTREKVRAVRLDPTESGPDSSPNLVLGDMTEVLSQGLPGTHRDREEILPELVRAGMYGPSALVEYRAIRTVLILMPLFFAVAIALLAEPKQMPVIALVGLILSFAGYSVPRIYVNVKARSRTREIERGLPVFADMLSIALLAGQGLTGALRRVTNQLRNSFPRMAQELEIVMRQTEMLNLNVAFEQWANRSQSPEVRNLSVILGQTQRLGNDVTTALMDYASNLRRESRHKAEAQAQRASFWMLFPTLLCLWIPAAILIVAPVYFEFAARRNKARETLQKTAPGDTIGKILTGPTKASK
jgi:tight adherence protein C